MQNILIAVFDLNYVLKITLKNRSRCGMTCMNPAVVCGALAVPGIWAGTGAIIGVCGIVSQDLKDVSWLVFQTYLGRFKVFS